MPLSLTVPLPVAGYVWDAELLELVREQQATIEGETVNVAISGPLAVTGTFWPATQPVSGTFYQATQPISIASMPSTPVTGTFYQATQPVSAASLPLPADAATATLQGTGNTSLGTLAAKDFATTAKQDTGNTSLGTIASKDFATQTTLALVATAARQDTGNTSLSSVDTKLSSQATATKQDTGNTSLGTIAGKDFATQATLAALLVELALKADLTDTQPISAASLPTHGVTGTFWQATQPISGTVTANSAKPATTAFTSPSALITSTTVLASNANRMGATIYNESGAICFIKLGATASLTSYTVQIPIGGSYEVPFGYTGVIDGITVAITAVLRVTEFTA